MALLAGPMHDATPNRLPSHHISRPRLVQRLADVRLVVVEAPGGYGKSVLAAELVEFWGLVPIWVALEAGDVPARLLAARLRSAAAAAGLNDAAAAMAAAGDDAPAAVDALMAALAGESCAIVIDDAHRAAPDGVALIERLAGGLGVEQRLIVLARHLSGGLARQRRAPAQVLDAADLALRPEETLRLCRDGFGLRTSDADGRALDAATGGWTAAAVLAASRSAHLERPLGAVLSGRSTHRDAMQAMLEEAITGAGLSRLQLAQLAVPPLLDEGLVEEVCGDGSLLVRAVELGLPMTRAPGGWWVLPDPVREHLGALAAAPAGVQRVAATYYSRRGELGVALQMLIGCGDAEGAAQLLEHSEPWVIDSINALELVSLLDALPDSTLDRHPRVLLTVARCCAGSWLGAHSTRLMARADQLVSADPDPALRRAIDVERLAELVDDREQELAESRARTMLAELGPGELLTKARALTVIGQALCWRRDAEGAFDVAAVLEAGENLRRASELQLRLGNRPAAATIAMFRGIWVELQLGRAQAALEQLEAGLTLAAAHPRRFIQALYCRAMVLVELGRFDDASADLEEVVRLSRRQADGWMTGYVAWTRMSCASLQGDAEGAVLHAREAFSHGRTSSWWRADGSELLADAADCLDRVGESALAADYLERARRLEKVAEPQVVMAQCALLARHGDPEQAREILSVAARSGIAPREHWRLALLDAYAAFRQGDAAAGALAARAFEQAAELGQPLAPMLRERDLTESLLGLAVATGGPAARRLQTDSLPAAIAVLGRFELTRGGRPVPLGSGQETRLLKLIAVSVTGVHVEAAIEALWPEVDPRSGRNRLRTVLNRLRESAPGVVLREGDALVIDASVRVDLERFTTEAREALDRGRADEAAALALARSAIARYRGPVLAFDPYEEWAHEPREVAQRRMLDLLDLCAASAARNGDLDESRRLVERTIELAPYEDHRYLTVAQILEAQGRKGAALSVLGRARAALAQLAMDPPEALVELERELRGLGDLTAA